MTTRSTLWTLLLVLSLSACHKQAGRKLGADPRQRESYSVGYKLGASLQRQKASIDVDAYVLGLREALAGTASQVSEEEIRPRSPGCAIRPWPRRPWMTRQRRR